MQAGPADGERKPLSHLVMDFSKFTNCPRLIEPNACNHSSRGHHGIASLLSASFTGFVERCPSTRNHPGKLATSPLAVRLLPSARNLRIE
jgi:hypothetical protein